MFGPQNPHICPKMDFSFGLQCTDVTNKTQAGEEGR